MLRRGNFYNNRKQKLNKMLRNEDANEPSYYDDFKNCANRNYANCKKKREENKALNRFLFGLVFV